ncbi:MAG TPA: helix-turn-helix domain-containing protein [Thermoanaerobaculia bacterium]|nr:helix-turn-helix domain-containing protein [Thermoanaerobaculia bacterium]
MPHRVRSAQAIRANRHRGPVDERARGRAVKRRAIFVYFDGCEVLDFAGPLQAMHEANALVGGLYDVMHCGVRSSATTEQGLALGGLRPLPEPLPDDFIFVPGFPVNSVQPPAALDRWMRTAYEVGARIFAVCTGSFILARSGLLDGRRCTTHWKRVAELQKTYRQVHVVEERLFVEDGTITTSAGITAGIDMTLDLIEREHGPLIAARVAREMVVYLRRDGAHRQDSIYLDHRTHMHPGVHAVQDWLVAHPAEASRLPDLARRAHMSVRNLTRAFQRATGVSIAEYRRGLRLEHAKSLLSNPGLTIENVAEKSGFSSARQLRRCWKDAHDETPGRARPVAGAR